MRVQVLIPTENKPATVQRLISTLINPCDGVYTGAVSGRSGVLEEFYTPRGDK